MNEADTRAELIEPALKAAGWGHVPESRVRREEIAPGRILTNGRRGKSKWADFILYHRGRKLAVVEAKAKGKGAGAGVAQAKDYADKLGVRFAYASDGAELYEIDMATGREGPCAGWPAPDTLWERTFAESNVWRERFAAIPFEDKSGQWEPRYYQDAAINAALDAVARGDRRILLTLATGTGKTAIAFQIAWKLFHARWNLSGEPGRRPRILFLADRNILADQAYLAFSAFEEDARARIKPHEIRKTGMVPKNASVFFTIFQTFMSGEGEDGEPQPYFGDYPPDFFDFIVIDECHRGGASDESSWRAIMEHFSPAVQLGLTATPKRTDNVDTYAWFGEPVYTYSLKAGIEDGFLTPFRVVDFSTTIDDYVHTDDNEVISGFAQAGDRFEAKDFNRSVVIREREEALVRLLLQHMDQKQKALIFCASQDHAALVRDLVNQHCDSDNSFYAMRVTADDGAYGEQQLKEFQDNEKTIPTVLTTSHKLSTGVDARNVRSIVLMREVKNMIEFKQIIGRGTRVYEGKTYFTIFDFYKNSYQFSDPAWDGEPEDVIGGESDPKPPKDKPSGGAPKEPDEPREVTRIKLSDGSVRRIQHMASTMFWGPDGRPITPEAFLKQLFGDIPSFFADEDELRRIWADPETRERLLKDLGEAGYDADKLGEVAKLIEAEDSDLFDVLAHIAYQREPKSRKARVEDRRNDILSAQADTQRQFIDFVLDQYQAEGVDVLSINKLGRLLSLKYGDVTSGVKALGGDPAALRQAFLGFQRGLYL